MDECGTKDDYEEVDSDDDDDDFACFSLGLCVVGAEWLPSVRS